MWEGRAPGCQLIQLKEYSTELADAAVPWEGKWEGEASNCEGDCG